MMFDFNQLIADFSVEGITTKQTTGTAGYYNDDGMWVQPSTTSETVALSGALVPFTTRQINDSGGRYSASDRHFYTHTKLEPKQHITYKGVTYSVEEDTDYTDYSNFFVYIARTVSAFAEN